MKALKALLLVFGVYLLVRTLQAVGMEEAFARLSEVGWKAVPLFLVYGAIYAFNTWGWIYSFPKPLPRGVPFRDLYVIRVIGETLNSLIPWAASLGGEPVKAHLLRNRHGVPVSEGLASLLIVHTTFYLSLNAFVIGALALTHRSRPLPPPIWHGVLTFLLVLGAGAVLLAASLRWGLFRRLHALAGLLPWRKAETDERAIRYRKLDEEVRLFYSAGRRRFWLSTTHNFAAWWLGTLEVYWGGKLLGLELSLSDAWLFESLIQSVRILTFFIPASVGAQEGGIVYLFTQLGFAAPQGLAFALLRRLREIVWMGIGLGFWLILKEGPKKP